MAETNVLLVDDEADFLSRLSERLQAFGLNTLNATSGEEALLIMKQLPIDVVILDVLMPNENGIDILADIKQDHPHTAVMLLSGVADLSTTIEGMRRRAFDYLIKPVNIDELIARIRDAAKRKSLQSELAYNQGGG